MSTTVTYGHSIIIMLPMNMDTKSAICWANWAIIPQFYETVLLQLFEDTPLVAECNIARNVYWTWKANCPGLHCRI